MTKVTMQEDPVEGKVQLTSLEERDWFLWEGKLYVKTKDIKDEDSGWVYGFFNVGRSEITIFESTDHVVYKCQSVNIEYKL